MRTSVELDLLFVKTIASAQCLGQLRASRSAVNPEDPEQLPGNVDNLISRYDGCISAEANVLAEYIEQFRGLVDKVTKLEQTAGKVEQLEFRLAEIERRARGEVVPGDICDHE